MFSICKKRVQELAKQRTTNIILDAQCYPGVAIHGTWSSVPVSTLIVLLARIPNKLLTYDNYNFVQFHFILPAIFHTGLKIVTDTKIVSYTAL